MRERVLVLGVGNPLVEDEGVGVRVVEELSRRYELPEHLSVEDAGTMGMAILNLFRETDRLLVVDAVDDTGHPPGTVLRFDSSELADNQVMHSLHDVRLSDVLQAAELAGFRPDTDFIGVQVGSMRPMREGLTAEVEAAIPDAIRAVLAVLKEYGVSPVATTEG